jgi:hypothetical protein
MCRIVRPTFSMSVVRKAFWAVVARGYGGSCCPRKYGLNWTIPAVVRRRLGSFGIREEDGTRVWSFSSKKDRNVSLLRDPSMKPVYRRVRRPSL